MSETPLLMSALAGLSGGFSRQQFISLQQCVGSEAIDFVERDGKVLKAERPGHKGWWRHRGPADAAEFLPQLTAQQFSKQLSSPYSAKSSITTSSHVSMIRSSDSSTRNSSNIASSLPRNHLSEAADVILEASTREVVDRGLPSSDVWRQALAELGLAAERQLSLGQPTVVSLLSHSAFSSVPVTGFDSSPDSTEDIAASGAVLGAQVSLGRRGSATNKNQDPGLRVNYDAFQNPGIVAASALDATASRSSVQPNQHIETAQPPLQPKEAEQANKSPGFKIQKLMTALWNLDRLDQRGLPLDQRFVYGSPSSPGTGKGVTIYILDSGIKAAHQEFQAWGEHDPTHPGISGRAVQGPDYIENDGVADDCDGHGTHVASTAAGRSVGVAKEANVVAVRVLDCDGAGSISDVIAALDWVAANAKKPAVASLSLGVPAGQWSRALEEAVRSLVGSGVPVVVAAGNDAKDCCQAAPHVTGWVAVYLEGHPQATPAEVQGALMATASSGSLQSQAMLASTPNRLLFTAVGEQQIDEVAIVMTNSARHPDRPFSNLTDSDGSL
eukprot:gene8443-8627_t